MAPFTKISHWEKILSLNAGLDNFSFNNQMTESIITGQKVQSKAGFGIEGELRYLFKNFETYKIGGSVGLGISYLSSNYSAVGYLSAEETADADKDTYYQIMNLSALSENISITGFNFPVKLNYEKSFSQNNGFYMNAGVVLSYYKGTYNIKTNYSSLGYYPQYNVTLQEIPALGFNDDQTYSGKGTLPINPINASGNIELGMFFRLRNSYQLYVGVNYNQAFLNFSSKVKSSALLTPNTTDASKSPVYNSIMSEMGNINLSVIGITIGIKKLSRTGNTQKNVNYLKL